MLVSKMEEIKKDIEELQKFLVIAQRPRVKDLLTLEIKKYETKLTQLCELQAKNQEGSLAAAASSSTSPTQEKQKVYDVKLTNYGWDQSDKFVKIYLSLKDVHTLDKSNVKCVFTQRSLELTVTGLGNRNYTFPIVNLLDDIKVDESYWKVKQDNVIIYLAKSNFGSKWAYLTHSEKKAQDAKLPKFEANSDPTAGLMDMMKQLYESGDDEMKRTIAKAWTESRDNQGAGRSTLDL